MKNIYNELTDEEKALADKAIKQGEDCYKNYESREDFLLIEKNI